MNRSLGSLPVVGLIVLVVSIPLISSLRAAPGDRDERDVRFEGGIGVDPIIGITPGPPASATLNIVRGVSPGGAPWRIGSLVARWTHRGDVQVDGRGLVLAAGNSIGMVPAAITSVVAAFFCGAGSTTPLLTVTTPLSAAGDFNIDASGFSVPPDPCVAPVLLIETGTGPVWLAAGIPVLDVDD
jgi:hypothetical protein